MLDEKAWGAVSVSVRIKKVVQCGGGQGAVQDVCRTSLCAWGHYHAGTCLEKILRIQDNSA